MKSSILISDYLKRVFDYLSYHIWIVFLAIFAVGYILVVQREAHWEIVSTGHGKVLQVNVLTTFEDQKFLHVECTGPHAVLMLDDNNTVCAVIETKRDGSKYLPGSKVGYAVLKNNKTGQIEYRLSK